MGKPPSQIVTIKVFPPGHSDCGRVATRTTYSVRSRRSKWGIYGTCYNPVTGKVGTLLTAELTWKVRTRAAAEAAMRRWYRDHVKRRDVWRLWPWSWWYAPPEYVRRIAAENGVRVRLVKAKERLP